MPTAERWTDGRPAILVANPTAQSGKAAGLVRHARAHLDAVGLRHRFVATEPEGRTVEQIRRLIDDDGARLIIYMGGDGTFAEVAKGILRSGHAPAVTMGMLPTGTANDQGKSFGLGSGPRALERNVRVIADGHAAALDVGAIVVERAGAELRRDWFFDSFSVGLSGSTLVARNRDRRLVARVPLLGTVYRDQMVYAGALARRLAASYVRDPKFDVDLVVDGHVMQLDAMLDVIVKNTEIFGGEWVFAQATAPDDGLFELIPVVGRRDFGGKMLAGFRHSPVNLDDLKRLGLELGETIRGASFQLGIRCDALPGSQIDGEAFVTGDRYRIDVAARALRLLVPKDPNEL